MNSRMTMPEAPAGEIDDGAEIAGNVSVRVVSDFTPPAVTPQAWNALVAASDAPVYLTFEWQSLWWRHFGGGRRLNIVMFTSGGKLVGAAPLFSGRGIMQEPGVLRLIGSGDAYTRSGGLFLDDGPSDYLDILIDPEFGQAVGRAFADYLHRNRGSIARVDLVNLRPGGPAATFVVPALRSRGFAVKESPGDLCPSIEVRARTEEFVRGLAPGVRRRMNQALKLADGPGSPVVLSENDPGGWERFYEDLVTLHQRRWNAAGFPGLFHDSRSAAFQRSVAGEFRRNGWLWYASLSEAGRCVAARLAFSFRGRMYDYLSGFD
ncbi:MAG TPA: GNAT family N-acetyltransferase, partial [Bacteroidota bacterium]|nr:GNAT family N-acetyltransferase [Bacteroidota bacterium]